MPRPSPSAQRVLAILTFFAEHPGSAFSLTDLIRGLRINRATCHGLLAEMVEAGYLYRGVNDKLYTLGHVAAQLGQVAQSHLSPLQVALPAMRRLADHHEVICSAVFRERDDIVIRERVAAGSKLNQSMPRGTRLPLRPPFGAGFLAWGEPEQIEHWLDGLHPAPSPDERQRTRDAAFAARERGFQYAVRAAPEPAARASADWLFIEDPAARPVQIGVELEVGREYRLAAMSAPVLDRKGQVSFVLSLSGFDARYSGAEITAIGTQLRDVADHVCEVTGGPVKRP